MEGMMTFPKYESYKDSGVEWLGEIPSHWELRKLKHIAKVRLSNVDKHSRNTEIPIRLCNYTDVYYRNFIDKEVSFMEATATKDQIYNFLLKKGDVLITKDSESFEDIAVPAYVPETLDDVICGYHLAHIRPVHIEGSYLFRSFQAENFAFQFRISANGITRFGIGKSAINDAIFLVPPTEEQKRIVEFLDRKTAEIDEAIAYKQRLIELLQEQKAILINQAVTKGLNPDAPMRDSGVEWIGEIPEHWNIKRVKHVSTFITSGPRGWAEYYADEGSFFLQSGNLNNSLGIDLERANRVQPPNDAEGRRTRLQNNDTLVCITGANTGRVAIAILKDEEVYINQHLCLIRPVSNVDSLFLSLCLRSVVGQTYFFLSQYGLKEGLGLDDVKNAFVLEPPLSEQNEIASFITKIIKDFDHAEEKITSQIAQINELKRVFISKAVTGKIKV